MVNKLGYFLSLSYFQGVNRLFLCHFKIRKIEQDTDDVSSKRRTKRLHLYYDWWTKTFWSSSKKTIPEHIIILKSFNRSDDDFGTGLLLDNLYFKENYSLIEKGLRKQQALDTDLKAIQKINSVNSFKSFAESDLLL